MIEAFIFLMSSTLTFAGIERYRRWSIRRRLLDIPNERSSHTTPVPRGAGLVIVTTCSLGLCVAYFFTGESPFMVLIIAGLALGITGWLDDLYSLPRTVKLFVQVIAAIILISSLGYFDYVSVGEANVFLWLPGVILTLFWFVGVVNAFNLMDGIDGIAGLQSFIAAMAWGTAGLMSGSIVLLTISCLVAGSCFAFLYHNWEPARVFLGDSGSTYLGFIFAVMPLVALYESRLDRGMIPIVAAAMIWPFVFDALFTFVRRLVSVRSKVFDPHRTHIYQLLVDSGWSHSKVAAVYGLGSLMLSISALAAFVRPSMLYGALPIVFIAVTTGLAYGYLISVKGAGKVAT